MTPLANENNGREQCIRLAPDTIPEAKCTTVRVSVRYVPYADKHRYVFRASYGREDFAADHLVNYSTYSYVAKRQTRKLVDGKTRKVTKNLIPNLRIYPRTSNLVQKCPAT